MTPNQMPRKGSPLTTVKRERHIERDCGCCDVFITEKVPALKGSDHRRRPIRSIGSTAMADALREAGVA